MVPGATLAEMPLVGRGEYLDRLVSWLKADEPAAFVLAGSAGVGKSRLATEVARSAARTRRAVARVVGTKAAGTIPFGAFAPLLTQMPAPDGGLLSLLRDVSDAVAQRATGDDPLLLVVDDAHLLDDGSAAVVHQLAHGASCRVVASVRTPGPAPEPIVMLWKDGLADRLDLNPLNESEVEELIRSALGAPMTGPGVRWLWETSAGNPLFLRELLVGAVESRALDDHGGMWTLRLPLPAPIRLSELVASRLAGLPEDTGDVIDLLALGEPLDLSLLSAIASNSAIEDAEQQGLITVRQRDNASEVGLSHPLYGEVRRHAMPRSRLRRLSGALAAALVARQPSRHDDEMRIARWQLDAGTATDAALLERAARSAREMFDLELAARLGRAAVDAGAGVTAGLALAEAQFFSGQHAEAEAVMVGISGRCVTDDEISLVANARAYNLGILIGDAAAAEKVIDEALARVTEPGPRCRLIYRQAVDQVYSGRPRQALAGAEEILKTGDGRVRHRGAFVASIALAMRGRTSEASAMALEGLEMHRRSGEVARLPEGQLIGGILGHLGGGRLSAAETDALTGHDAALQAGDKDALATFCLLRGWVYLDRGVMAEASRMFREGLIINRETNDLAPQRFCLGGLAIAEAMVGHPERAGAAATELDALPHHWMDAFEPDLILRGRGWAQAAAGELSAARDTFREGASLAAEREQPISEARLQHDLARLGEQGPASERLTELLGSVDGVLVEALTVHARALAEPSGAGLEAAARLFEEIGAWALAAEAGSSASMAYREEGLARAAAACANRAAQFRDQCGGVSAPGALISRDGAQLTRREREVAALAARDLTSREIADRLYLSVRTVDNHLQRVYMKLGVTSRDELASALRH